ncbi:SDR family oxidoreductase [Aeromicrobium wangtongii]|uniref:SDR family oxidoreductase n=1 Tax=Aeromicrobium wangtongii TaxID=2969247 RepID=UPI0020173629|nr:SDR family oxidoreductase [Aeromicrobium wangtongii]MCL3817899.1 SDR family oxidoreductase [Aeromicrobium wangtongii]
MRPTPHALVVGATGIAGSALAQHLVDDGWQVTGLSRRQSVGIDGVEEVHADLSSSDEAVAALGGTEFTHVFITAWVRCATEDENIAVNSAMVRNLLDAVRPAGTVQHVALMTGLKHYLGPFDAYGAGEVRDTPFHEDEERLPYPNFYYAQEDELWAAAERDGFTWSVHRAHTVIGTAVGNAMNMAQTLAVQAAISREHGRPFVFPGSQTQWNGLTDMTDAGLLAEHMQWASTTEAAANNSYNIVNGDVFRWRWMWPRIAELLGVEAEGFSERPRPLEQQMVDAPAEWKAVSARHGLAVEDVSALASWWHTDADLGRDMECLTDMRRSRLAGFDGNRPTLDCFVRVFDELRQRNLIPVIS